MVLNQKEQTIFHYGDKQKISEAMFKQLMSGQLVFTEDDDLLIWVPIEADNYSYGSTIIKIDSKTFREKNHEHAIMLLVIFPLIFIFLQREIKFEL